MGTEIGTKGGKRGGRGIKGILVLRRALLESRTQLILLGLDRDDPCGINPPKVQYWPRNDWGDEYIVTALQTGVI